MTIKRIEALVDAIAILNDFYNPESKSYQLRNPVLARAFSFKHLASTDESGFRQFTSTIGGYRYAVEDALIKCKGESRAKGINGHPLKSDSTIADYLWAMNQRNPEEVFLAIEFLQKALKNMNITSETPLSFFLELSVEDENAKRSF